MPELVARWSVEVVGGFDRRHHIRNVLNGEWIDLVDEVGTSLPGIRGQIGAASHTTEGRDFGADLIEIRQGNAFPIHQHPGDHILYVIQGSGLVYADGTDHPVAAGDTIFIPAEHPHGVTTPAAAGAPLVILAVGHPHRRLDARDRERAIKPDPE